MTMSFSISTWDTVVPSLSLQAQAAIRRDEPMARHTTLRVGGAADYFVSATDKEVFAEVVAAAQRHALPYFLLGEGSNVCVSDRGVRGMVVQNACRSAEIGQITHVDCGHTFMRLFLKTMRAGLSGLEFAVGIPGTVGGALVSNAGAYRANICDLVREIEVVENGERKRVSPDWMEFSYRDSRLRREGSQRSVAALISVTLDLKPSPKTPIRTKAKDFQMQRILKQPWEPSAGSFFKNVYDRSLAKSLPQLPESMKRAGVVPAAYLSEACGMKGYRVGGAGVSPKHANFIVNRGKAMASEIRAVADEVKRRVSERFGVVLEEEVMSLGEW